MKPQWYDPSPSLLDDDPTPLIDAHLPGSQYVRTAQHSLLARAMLRCHTQQPQDAVSDCLAAYQLARHMKGGYLLIEQTIAFALAERVNHAVLQVLQSGRLDNVHLHQLEALYAKDFDSVSVAAALDFGERLMALDAVNVPLKQLIPRTRGQKVPPLQPAEWQPLVDLNIVLRFMNDRFDAGVAVANLPIGRRRWAALQEHTRLQDQLLDDMGQRLQKIATLRKKGVPLSRLTARAYATLLYPNLEVMLEWEARHECQRRFVLLAIASERFRNENGDWPEDLPQLANEVGPDATTDPYHGRPFSYCRGSRWLSDIRQRAQRSRRWR